MPGASVQSTNQALALAQLSRLNQHQLPADSHSTSLPQASAASALSRGEYRLRQISAHDSDNDRISMDSNHPLLSAESPGTAGSNSPTASDSQLELSSTSKTQVEDIRLSVNSTRSSAAHRNSEFQLATQSQAPEQTWAELRNSASGESKAQGKYPSRSSNMTHTQADKDRETTSFELRQWAREQGKTQPQSRAVSDIQNSLDLKDSKRTRSLDLLRADLKNIRLSIESARLPQGEKMLCMSVEEGMLKVITSQDAFKMIAEGAQSTITGFAFDHMLKVTHRLLAFDHMLKVTHRLLAFDHMLKVTHRLLASDHMLKVTHRLLAFDHMLKVTYCLLASDHTPKVTHRLLAFDDMLKVTHCLLAFGSHAEGDSSLTCLGCFC